MYYVEITHRHSPDSQHSCTPVLFPLIAARREEADCHWVKGARWEEADCHGKVAAVTERNIISY